MRLLHVVHGLAPGGRPRAHSLLHHGVSVLQYCSGQGTTKDEMGLRELGAQVRSTTVDVAEFAEAAAAPAVVVACKRLLSEQSFLKTWIRSRRPYPERRSPNQRATAAVPWRSRDGAAMDWWRVRWRDVALSRLQ